ncbi:MAG: PEP-CTERM sorting domain-containing protein [Phycisphaerae bacterium]
MKRMSSNNGTRDPVSPKRTFASLKQAAVFAGVAVACGMFAAGTVQATQINVANYNFADTSAGTNNNLGYSIASWMVSSNSVAGLQNIGTPYWSSATVANWPTAPGGQSAWINDQGSIFQDATATDSAVWQPNSTYTFSVYYGVRSDYSPAIGGMSLIAGTVSGTDISSNAVVEASNNDLAPTPGTFAQYTLSFTTGSTAPTGDVILELSQLNTYQGNFDNVQLNAPAAAVPEPASLGLLLGVSALGLLLANRRRLARPTIR